MIPPVSTRLVLKRSLLAVLIGSLSFQMPGALAAGQMQPGTSDPCASNGGQAAGAVIGALLGGFLGNKVGKGNGRKVATVVGALGGLTLGNYVGSEIDRRKCEVSRIAQKNNLQISVTDIALPATPDDYPQGGRPAGNADKVGMSVSIEDRPASQPLTDAAGGDGLGNAAVSTQFRSGSDALTADAEGYFREIAAQYARAFDSSGLTQDASPEQVQAVQGLRQKRILIVGHTDDTGSSRLNADLSEQRARNVGRLFADAGVPSAQVYYQGSGETQPVADNRSESGRARNRRVEIVDLPDEQAFQRYLSNRVANTSFYRVTETAAAPDAAAAPASGMAERPAKAGRSAPAGNPGTNPGSRTAPASRMAASQSGAGLDGGAHAGTEAGTNSGTAAATNTGTTGGTTIGANAGTSTANNAPPAQPGKTGKQATGARLAGQPAPAAAAGAAKAARAGGLANPAAGYDFGGAPAAQQTVAIDIGRPLSKPGFNLISPAIADDMPTARSCADDRPRYANAVKELQGNREYHVSQYLPNLYDTSWSDTVNGNLVALTHVAVLRDGAAPARNPTVLIYKAARGKPNTGSKADFNGVAHVNTYQGERGLLYRVFVNGPIQCMDLVLPRDQAVHAVNSNLYYQAGGTKMVATYNPKIVK
jgi:outer membrane protein OmpA-like peptidoglycan-associated protein